MNSVRTVIEKVKQADPARVLVAAALVLALGVLVQAVRYVGAVFPGGEPAEAGEPAPGHAPPERKAEEVAAYQPIAEHGFLGKPKRPPEASPAPKPKCFGVLGSHALFGSSADGAEPYRVGQTIPGGETIVEIRGDRVIVAKDGTKRTVEVFPKQ